MTGPGRRPDLLPTVAVLGPAHGLSGNLHAVRGIVVPLVFTSPGPGDAARARRLRRDVARMAATAIAWSRARRVRARRRGPR